MRALQKISFVGSGKMATAIGGGLVKSGKYFQNQFLASDNDPKSREYFKARSGISSVVDNNILVTQKADIVILAVKPQNMVEVCSEIRAPCKNRLIISIAAGIKLNTLYNLLDYKRIIRIMPNTPMMVGLGASAFSMGQDCTEDDKKVCLEMFSTVGNIFEVKEELMDAVTAVSGSGPAYVFQFIQALTEAGIRQGLDPQASLELVKQTVLGAATMVSNNIGTPEELTKAVTSPNGTTYAALQNMKKNNFYGMIDEFVIAATERSKELGNPSK